MIEMKRRNPTCGSPRIAHQIALAWGDVHAFREEILTFAKLVTPGESLDAVPADPTDNRILECAVAAGSEVIVSGDKHLLGLGSFRGIEIVSVGEFLQHGPLGNDSVSRTGGPCDSRIPAAHKMHDFGLLIEESQLAAGRVRHVRG